MVFPGKRSAGCFLCRKRRVKCDEAHPSCHRCRVYGAACPGYRSAFAFTSENERVHRRALLTADYRSPKPKAHRQQQVSSALPPRTYPWDVLEGSYCLAPQIWPLTTSWENASINYFIHQHVLAPRPESHESYGHLGFVPDLYLAAPSDSCVRLATNAVAQMSFSRLAKSSSLELQAITSYQRALQTLSSSLLREDLAIRDETLVAVLLLGLFEDIIGTKPARTENPHVVGMLHVLCIRGNPHLQNRRDISLFSSALVQVLFNSLISDRPDYCNALLPDLVDEPYKEIPLLRIGIWIGRYSQSVQNKCTQPNAADMSQEKKPTIGKKELLVLFHEGILIQRGLDDWARSLPEEWEFSEDDSQRTTCGITIMQAYRSKSMACNWALLRTALIFFYARLILCIRQLLGVGLGEILAEADAAVQVLQSAQSMMSSLPSEICASACFALGHSITDGITQPLAKCMSAYGHLLTWPLSVVARNPYTSESDRVFSKSALRTIGFEIGIGVAVSVLHQLDSFNFA